MKSTLQNIIPLLFLFSCYGCKKTNESVYKYVGTHNNGQASMTFVINDYTFNGTYIIEYTDQKKDSGTINGEIKDNVWLGKYNYVSRNGDRKIKPIAFVLDNNRMIRGEGTVYEYFNIPHYKLENVHFHDSLGVLYKK